MRPTVPRLGGGGKFHSPGYVWSPAGGWYGNTRHWMRNSYVAVGVMATVSAVIWMKSNSIEVSAVTIAGRASPLRGAVPHTPACNFN